MYYFVFWATFSAFILNWFIPAIRNRVLIILSKISLMVLFISVILYRPNEIKCEIQAQTLGYNFKYSSGMCFVEYQEGVYIDVNTIIRNNKNKEIQNESNTK